MTQYIMTDSTEMMRQAQMTAHDYLLGAVRDIDATLGQGVAAKHPELVAAYMQTASIDYGATILAQQVRAGLETIAEVINRLRGQ
jgi:hypothetical protein